MSPRLKPQLERLGARALHYLARLLVWVSGWRVVGKLPPEPKVVLIAAPHTSNWDGVLMVACACVFQIRVLWLGKRELFHGLQGRVLDWLGGIPVQRESAHAAFADALRALARHERVILAIPPEGTRRKTTHWKMGFYLIARRAGLPIVLGFADYRHHVAGLGPTIYPSGDLEADLELIRRFYRGVAACHPENVGEIRAAPRAPARPTPSRSG
jgi:1-acyl-sn-glycerol-3-phosphate acyltransferase